MTLDEMNKLFDEIQVLLEICKDYENEKGVIVVETVKPCILQMINFIVKDKNEAESLSNSLDSSDFWVAPASSRFHANYKGGLAVHTFMVIKQCLIFSKSIFENFYSSPKSSDYSFCAEDIFISALAHDLCKTNFYTVEYRNTKDITGNWIKQPYYKTKNDNRNLGHGNESVLKLLEVMPSYVKKRHVLEAISRHMGFSDLSTSESYNYSLFLENPLVILLQLSDQTAANWYNA